MQEKSIDFSPSWPFPFLFPRKPLGLFSQYPALCHRWQVVYFSWLSKTSTPLGEGYSLHSPQFITSLPGTCSLFSHLVFSYPSASLWGKFVFIGKNSETLVTQKWYFDSRIVIAYLKVIVHSLTHSLTNYQLIN